LSWGHEYPDAHRALVARWRDAIIIADDTNIYIVAVPGTIVLAEPGLLQAITAAATALIILNNSVRSMAFSCLAIQFATRMPGIANGRRDWGEICMTISSSIKLTWTPRSTERYGEKREQA
jgi:hypothetical protein